jgi:hypothetical protein
LDFRAQNTPAPNWTTVGQPGQPVVVGFALDTTHGILYATSQYDQIIYRCDTSTGCDAVGEWTESYSTSNSPYNGTFSLAFDPYQGVMYAGIEKYVYRCDTSTGCTATGNWSRVFTSTDVLIQSLTVDTTNNVLYAGSGDGLGIIYRCDIASTDCNASGDFTTSYNTSEGAISSLLFDATNGVIYAGSQWNDYIYRCAVSTGCTTSGNWTGYSFPTSLYYGANALTMDTTNHVLYAGSDNGIYRCDTATGCDALGDWTTSYTTPETVINNMVFDEVHGMLFATTGNNGRIYQCPISTGCTSSGNWSVSFDSAETDIIGLGVDGNGVMFAGSSPNGYLYRYENSSATNYETYGSIGALATNTSIGAESGALLFSTLVGGTSTETLRIVGGNVGIGRTTPAAKLDVAGSATISGSLSLAPNVLADIGACTTATAGKMYYDGPANKYYFCNGTSWTEFGSGGAGYWSASGSDIYNTNSGNVGIGTTPSVKLDILGVGTDTTYGTTILTNGDFASNFTGWTAGAGWAAVSNAAQHTAGNTATLARNISVTDGTTYQIEWTDTGGSSGMYTFSIGGEVSRPYRYWESQKKTTIIASGTGSQSFAITPDTNYNGSIDTITVRAVTASPLAQMIIRNADGSENFVVRSGGIDLDNIYIGKDSGSQNTTGYYNVALGVGALASNTAGQINTAIGAYALTLNTTGYNNTAIGNNALSNNTFGTYNTAVGSQALELNIEGGGNTAIGTGALYRNTASYNTAVGDGALYDNTIGESNTAVGEAALGSNTIGNNNVALGVNSLLYNTEGNDNIAIGLDALRHNLTGNANSALGASALYSNTIGYSNTAFGYNALASNTEGHDNNAFGDSALVNNTTGTNNIAIGTNTMEMNTTGYSNVALGSYALNQNTIGYSNSAVGYSALGENISGTNNVAFGRSALAASLTGYANTALGNYALEAATTGDDNTAIGYGALGINTTGYSNISIGNYSLSDLLPVSGAITVFADSATSPGTKTTVTSASHGQINGASIAITGTTNYDGAYTMSNVTTHTFDIVKVYTVNDATGWWSLNGQGAHNVAVGYSAGSSLVTGAGNVFIGDGAGNNALQATDAYNSTAIGNDAYTTADNQVVIGNADVTETILHGDLRLDNNVVLSFKDPDGVTDDTVLTYTTGNNTQLYGGLNINLMAGDGDITLETNLLERLRVLNNGNIGIGTGAPAALLDVNGTTTLRSDVVGANGGVNGLGDQQSMVPNAGFEVDNNVDSIPDGWTGTLTGTGTLARETTNIRQGSAAIKYTSTSAANTYFIYSNCFPVTGGISYNFHAWAYASNVTVTQGNILNTYDTKAGCTGTPASPSNTYVTQTTTAPGTSYVTRGGTTATVIATTARWARAVFTGVLNISGAIVYIDSARVVPAALTTAMDIAENYYTQQDLLPGQLVKASSGLVSGVEKTTLDHEQSVLGVVTTHPAMTLGDGIAPEEHLARIALAGRVPVIVSTANGTITSGDPITSSSMAYGVGTKAIETGTIVGKALESTQNWTGTTCQDVASVDAIVWPEDDGTNTAHPCFRLADGTFIGKIMMFVNLSWFSPEFALDSAGSLSFVKTATDSSSILVDDRTGKTVNTIGAFAEAVAASVRAGTLRAQEGFVGALSVENLTIAGQSLQDYILSVVESVRPAPVVSPVSDIENLKTSVISPLTDDGILTVQLTEASGSALVIKNNFGQSVASFDVGGNATLAGTLTADKIRAREIEGLSVYTTRVEELASQSAKTQEEASRSAGLIADLASRFTSIFQTLYIKVEGVVEGAWTVLGRARFAGTADFEGETKFTDRVTLPDNSAGVVVIPQWSTRVPVVFSKPFGTAPMVTVTAVLSSTEASGSAFISDASKVAVTQVTETGFTIVLDGPAPQALEYNWIAIAVGNRQKTVGVGIGNVMGEASPSATQQ